MAVKPRQAIKDLFVTGNLNESDFIDFADSHFNLVDDRVTGALLLDNSVGINSLTSSAMSILNTPDGLNAWAINVNGDFLPFAGHFQDIGSVTYPVGIFYTDSIITNASAILPFNTIIGSVTASEISYLSGVTSGIQQQIDSIVISGGGGAVGYTHTQAILSQVWTITHNKNSDNLVYLLMDENKNQIMPNNFRIIDINTVEFTFNVAQIGRVNIVFY